MPRVGRRFFSRPADELAPALLGCRLVRVLPDGTRLAGIIVEAEAYMGPEDRAAHTYNGRRTTRTEPMYMAPGTSYVYFTYGMHFCMNVSAGAVDVPHAVLLRALEPTEGLEQMAVHRAGKLDRGSMRPRDLCSGPAKLCQALAIDRALNAVDLCRSEVLFLESGPRVTDDRIGRDARIGLNAAGEWTEKPLRWLILENPFVSRGVRVLDSARSM